jgi:hypothetical protein
MLVRDSAFQRVIAMGGPLTAHGRARRCYTVWLQASDRLERALRLACSLERKGPEPVDLARALSGLPAEAQ